MIEVYDICKTYQVGNETIEAVKGVSLSAEPGELIAVMGHSGCGKSTLLSMIGGLTRPTKGTVRLAGEDIWALDDKARSRVRNQKIGFMFQFASLIPTLNSLDNVVLPGMFRPHGISADDYQRALDLLELVGLPDKVASYPNELSGGQQRRVAIARSLMNAPPVLLADEPTGDLDEDTEAEVLRLLVDVVHSRGTVLIMVTHNPGIPALADRVLRMKNGVLQ
jgi:ABC-type lipoprotein export system ATPase subunit